MQRHAIAAWLTASSLLQGNLLVRQTLRNYISDFSRTLASTRINSPPTLSITMLCSAPARLSSRQSGFAPRRSARPAASQRVAATAELKNIVDTAVAAGASR